MLGKRRRSDFHAWRMRSMLTPDLEQMIFLIGGIGFVVVAAVVLSTL